MLKLISSILLFLGCIGIALSEDAVIYPRLWDSPPAIVSDKGLYVDELRLEPALLEPPDGSVYHGACLMTYEEGSDPIGPYLAALNDSTIQPAVRGFFITIPGERGPDNSFKGLKKFFQSADSIGFIPEVSLFFMDKRGSTDSIIAVSNTHDWIIDSIITLSKNYGKRMFLRIGGEFNGAGPGWNGGGYHPYLYVTMFRKIVDMFESRGFRDSIAVNWCYEPDAPNDFDSVDSRGARWYPGDRYADWFGLDVFDPSHFDQSLPDYTGRSITKKGKSERFLAMAREKGKPVFMSETSAKGMNISSDEQDGINDWKDWFAKFWEFIAVHKEIKGFNYINANWPVSAYPGWGDSRIQNSAYVAQKYREEMKKPKYIHLPTKTGSLLIPLTDLGQEKYRDSSGGLYPGNSNIRPETHETDGIELANEIAPLDIYGSKDLMKGRIVLLSVGMSITDIEFNKFISLTDTFKMLNPYLTLVNGAQGGKTANIIRDPNDIYWKNIDSTLLKAKNVTNNQVQIVWLKNTNHNDGSGFPEFAKNLKEDLKKITKLMLNKYPNLKLVYLSTRSYGGYATIPSSTEPYAYETGFSVKWLIEEQISGSKDLTFSESGRNAPWLSWGPYFWANGVIPRNDGFFWLEEDFGPDGTHPSSLGAAKAANMLLDFFSTDKTAIPWFLAKPTSIENDNEKNGNIIISPNPASDYVEINVGNTHAYSLQQDLKIYNALGECVINLTPALSEGEGARFDVSQLVAGVYFVTYSGKTCKFIKY